MWIFNKRNSMDFFNQKVIKSFRFKTHHIFCVSWLYFQKDFVIQIWKSVFISKWVKRKKTDPNGIEIAKVLYTITLLLYSFQQSIHQNRPTQKIYYCPYFGRTWKPINNIIYFHNMMYQLNILQRFYNHKIRYVVIH